MIVLRLTTTLMMITLFSLPVTNSQSNINIDVQGHRGARGLLPENTIPAFEKAIEIGVSTLELDVVISADNKVIVSHEPFMSHEICLDPEGNEILKEEEHEHNIFKLDYADIKSYDCGSKFVDRFPNQEKLKTHKPSLSDMVTRIEQLSDSHYYNIEIKRRPVWDNDFHPGYKEFADLVIQEIMDLGIMERTTVQCFDVQSLQYIHESYPDVILVYLIQNMNSINENLDILGFVPEIYSPYYKLIKSETVKVCKEKSMRLIPWTVNDPDDMKSMIEMGVDGIISDYPDILKEICEEHR